ncbi:unnamed protein product [Staurois parvus]|uniref:Uncharacterized protein n=1 Tax=Staurois parvus TaxID=386267 RepID=A0ABN9D1B5_9NEOB|nr:unnamed protein product [Staurois parvus]
MWMSEILPHGQQRVSNSSSIPQAITWKHNHQVPVSECSEHCFTREAEKS